MATAARKKPAATAKRGTRASTKTGPSGRHIRPDGSRAPGVRALAAQATREAILRAAT